MPTEDRIRFTFISAAMDEDTFTVVRFKGREGLSQLYEFDIILDAEDPEVDLKEVLKNPARLIIQREGADDRVIHGIPARFEQLHEVRGHVYYRALLVPRLWLSDLYHENQLFLDKSVPEIIEEILRQAGLTSRDYELKLTAEYPPWEYICQYNETDFNFMSRWMEREGIYYYFDQTDEGEKLIITDSSTAHQDIAGEAGIRYSPPDSLIPSVREQVREFTCRQQILPKKVILKDYNYRKPSLDLKGEADVDTEGRGNVYIYGEHFKTPEQGDGLARIRAQELLCRETVYFGEGTVPSFLPGYIFGLEDHYRDSCNRRYLIVELTHEGVQANFLTGTGNSGPEDEEIQTPSYYNRFTCIPDDVQFRPERRAIKPRLDSTLNARVDAAGDGQYAEIDDQGRYKIKLPFDQSDAGDGKASRWVRMAQPYAGADYGMHFPLHKGTEVVLTFVNGDPDRPIIAGTVPNPETMSPVTSGNHTRSVIRTGGNNEIALEDREGGQLIKMSSPTENSFIRIGAPNPSAPPGLHVNTNNELTTDVGNHAVTRVGNNYKVTIGGEEYRVVTGQVTREFHSNSHKITRGNQIEETYGDKTSMVKGNTKETFTGTKVTDNLAATQESFVGAKASQALAATSEIFVGVKQSACAAFQLETNASLKVEKSAERVLNAPSKLDKITGKHEEMVGSYELTSLGKIELDASGVITINSSSKIVLKAPLIKLDGKVEGTKDVTGNKDLTVRGKSNLG